jgi:hemoglobin
MSLYDEIGGDAAIDSVVSDYWHRVIGDDVLSPWFDGIDTDLLNSHLRAYLAVALDGPENYEGRSMRLAHTGLRVTDAAFDRLLAQMSAALRGIDLPEQTILRVESRLAPLRPVIVEPRLK